MRAQGEACLGGTQRDRELEGLWLFYQHVRDTEAWPGGTALCQGQEALADGGAAWTRPVPERLRLSRHVHSVTDHVYPSAVLQHAGVPVKGEEGKKGLAAVYVQVLCQGLAARAVREAIPSPPHFGDIGVIFPSEVRDSYQKKQFGHRGRGEGRVGWGSQSMEVQ